MQHTKVKNFIIVALLIMLPVSFIAAQGEMIAEELPTETSGFVLANVNLGDIQIISQTAEAISLSFVLTNGDSKPQSDIRYGVDLLRVSADGGQTKFDSYIAPEILVLAPNEVVTKTITYSTLGIAPGSYQLWVTAQTAGGVMLGLGTAGEVVIAGQAAVSIESDSCFFTVAGEAPEIKYNLYQGVDVATTEELILTCTLKNHSNQSQSVIPVFENYVRTVYGDRATMSYPKEDIITLLAGEEKVVSLVVPKPAKPQAYGLIVGLVDATTGAAVSNHLVAHYVLQGVSATIQTANFTKTSFDIGETIELNLFWTPSADGFPGSRLGQATEITGAVSAELTVTNKDGLACAESITQILPEEILTLSLVATARCESPIATVKLLGPAGVVLDSRTITSPVDEAFVLTAENPTALPATRKSTNPWTYVALGGLALASMVALLLVFRRQTVDKRASE